MAEDTPNNNDTNDEDQKETETVTADSFESDESPFNNGDRYVGVDPYFQTHKPSVGVDADGKDSDGVTGDEEDDKDDAKDSKSTPKSPATPAASKTTAAANK